MLVSVQNPRFIGLAFGLEKEKRMNVTQIEATRKKSLVRKTLRRHGPMTSRRLGELCGITQDGMNHILKRNPDLFQKVDTNRPVKWGLV